MPKYAVTVQNDRNPQDDARHPRAAHPGQNTRTIIEALSIAGAIDAAKETYQVQDSDPRIVSVEELSTWQAEDITDEQITAALMDNTFGPEIHPDDFEDNDDIAESLDFHDLVQQVQRVLGQSNLVPGLEISLIHTDAIGVDGAMVEIHDSTTGTYRAKFSELDELILDRSATGWDGVISLARGIMRASEDLM